MYKGYKRKSKWQQAVHAAAATASADRPLFDEDGAAVYDKPHIRKVCTLDSFDYQTFSMP